MAKTPTKLTVIAFVSAVKAESNAPDKRPFATVAGNLGGSVHIWPYKKQPKSFPLVAALKPGTTYVFEGVGVYNSNITVYESTKISPLK